MVCKRNSTECSYFDGVYKKSRSGQEANSGQESLGNNQERADGQGKKQTEK